MSRLARILLLAALTFSVAAPAASAARTETLEGTLAALWTKVLQTPSPQNSYGSGGLAFACWQLGSTVAPLAPNGVKSCTVKPNTKIYIAESTHECSTFVPEDHAGYGTTEADLRKCARAYDAQVAPTATVDGHSVPVTQVETPLLNITVPANNIFDVPAGTQGTSVAHGWVTLLDPLTLGKHKIVIHNGSSTITTTITVQ
ncbi:MAG: hypothetical protein QOJ85_1407 [Solirubrobacteraceae bacterium]|nr:hypothetical protein [Solirubrobacteraceae bacterium]